MDQKVEESKNKLGFVLASNKSTVAVGLGIVIQVPGKSNIVISPALRLKPLKHHPKHLSTFSAQSSFLSSCYLCNRLLSSNNDVYMYRGDQGFCSTECRSRQMTLDEIREVEASTKKKLGSLKRRCHNRRSETRELLEALRHRPNRLSCHKPRALVS